MALATNLGFPRIGAKRQLKTALESFWAGTTSEERLLETARQLRRDHWRLQAAAGLNHIPSNDFALYDQMLDTMIMVGAVPERFRKLNGVSRAFAMARGRQAAGVDVPALEMTKWFDTNYHYIVPELRGQQLFSADPAKPLSEFREALELGVRTRPVLIGPVTFLKLSKLDGRGDPLALLPGLIRAYEEIVSALGAAGAEWIQMDEPCLALDLSAHELEALRRSYAALRRAASPAKLLLASYFEGFGRSLPVAARLDVDAIHLDAVRGAEEMETLLSLLPPETRLSIGLIDGRNVWATDLSGALATLQRAAAKIGSDRVWVAPSCSLLHVPADLELETKLDGELKSWLAFARQKIGEIALLARALNEGEAAVAAELGANRNAVASRRSSPRIHREDVKARVRALTERSARRDHEFSVRREKQRAGLRLPPLPTTTIGSFPQTAEIRAARRAFKNGTLDAAAYAQRMRDEINLAVRAQEELGLDVLAHGEPERNDMVEYFGEQLDGFAFTENGWVQSYGSRCVKPPLLFGDVRRSRPMTVEWIAYAQSITPRQMKGMLTGPITILQWSFVRDDQPRRESAIQIALAVRDEVADLERAGIRIIQIDEAAIREGLPLRKAEWPDYFDWAVRCFRVASAGAKDETQIHTHMCYSEFNDMIEAIAAMDADVVTIEASRSGLELLDALRRFSYPNEIGPGVYDIHSPRVPSVDEIRERLRRALEVIPAERLWVNPDCGLKTRGWPETLASLRNMVAAARALREETTVAG